MKKRLLAAIAAVIMILALGAPALAVEPFISIREEQLLYTGENMTLNAKVTTVKGKYECTWSISEEGVIRIVPDGKSVHIRALRPGEVTLTLVVKDEAASYTRTCNVIVRTNIKTVDIGGLHELTVGETTMLSAKTLPEDAEIPGYTWESSNSAVARVDENGVVVALSKGTVKISAVALNQIESEPHEILVKPAPLSGTYTPPMSEDGLPLAQGPVAPWQTPAMPLYAGTQLQLTLENLDHKYDPSWPETVFGTNDAHIATIDHDGLVTGHNPGTVMIYTYDKKTSKLIKVWNLTVYDKGKMTLNKSSATIKLEEKLALSAYVDGYSTVANWKTSDAAVAVVNSNGVVTGTGKGSAVITAYIGQDMAAECKVKVK